MKKRIIKYGGAITGRAEEQAIIKSIRNSRKTHNWQQAEEGKLFEKELADYLGVKYAILTNSGSSAGLLALSALELPQGSEVIISAVTFPTIFNIIIQCGLIPVVVDAKVGTYNFDVDDIERAISKNTRAIIAIHALGNPVDMPKLMKLVRGKNIKVLEDGCDAFGTTIRGKHCMSFGDVSITSLHAAHIISCGVGGAVFTNNKEIAKNVRMYRDWGRQADINKSENLKHSSLPKDYNPRFIYEKIGYNFQILDLQAAMGRVQLKQIEKIKSLRKKHFDFIYNELSQYEDLILPQTIPNADVCWFAFPLTTKGDRGTLLRFLESKGIETRPMFAGNITRHPAYKNTKYITLGDLKDSDHIMRQSFWISCHPSLTKKDLEHIIKAFNNFFNENT
ncbi:MAG: hypothetical protein A3F10_05005 [Coxiella sp. RIFCSPHIGHO2_12_FULL_42_15]|nr:MAG: hypothetical protein A3F10_05005 [Coxiella sp. RIFCSPHIGHO2_12_FULL_42_15]